MHVGGEQYARVPGGPVNWGEREACARLTHEARRAYCMAIGEEYEPPWAEAPDWQRNSARSGVKGVVEVLGGNNPGLLAEIQARLPSAMRIKDELFTDIVRVMVKALDADFDDRMTRGAVGQKPFDEFFREVERVRWGDSEAAARAPAFWWRAELAAGARAAAHSGLLDALAATTKVP
jgi:hypothetical protein